MKVSINEVRKVIREELEAALEEGVVLSENIGFATARPPGILPQTYEDFRKCFAAAFTKLNLKGIAGKSTNLYESNSVIDGLGDMWAIVEKETTGFYGTPAPVFKEGREFWDYYGPDFEGPLARMIESQLPGAHLAKGNTLEIAKNVIDNLRAGG